MARLSLKNSAGLFLYGPVLYAKRLEAKNQDLAIRAKERIGPQDPDRERSLNTAPRFVYKGFD